MKKNIVVMLIAAFMISGCTTGPDLRDKVKDIMDPWVGVEASTLIAQVGEPDSITTDDEGGKFLVYDRYIELGAGTGEIVTDYAGFASYMPAKKRKTFARKTFYVDSKGIISAWKTSPIGSSVGTISSGEKYPEESSMVPGE